MQSVRAQRFCDFEHLIVDGGSIDGTQSILAQHHQAGTLQIICSESDFSVYEAWNKALNCVSRDWVLFLGSDDWLINPNCLAQAAEAINQHSEAEHCNFVCGHVLGRKGERLGLTTSSWAWRESEHWLNRWRGALPLPAHPGILHRASLFGTGVKFDASYRICADLKFLWENNFTERHCWIDVALSSHQPGGLSQSAANAELQRHERRRMLAELGRPRPGWIEPVLALKDQLKYIKC